MPDILSLIHPPMHPKSFSPERVDSIKPYPAQSSESSIENVSIHALRRPIKKRNPTTKSQTTYAKPPYFSHIKELEPAHANLIKERFQEDRVVVTSPELLQEAKKLQQNGILKQTPKGLVYLHISDDYIHDLYPFFSADGAQKPPYCAHIAIISEEEAARLSIEEIQELGKCFTFEIKDCLQLTLRHSSDVESVWVLTVKCPALEHLRERYGLSSQLHSQEFYSLLGIKLRSISIHPKEEDLYYFRVNPAFSYA